MCHRQFVGIHTEGKSLVSQNWPTGATFDCWNPNLTPAHLTAKRRGTKQKEGGMIICWARPGNPPSVKILPNSNQWGLAAAPKMYLYLYLCLYLCLFFYLYLHWNQPDNIPGNPPQCQDSRSSLIVISGSLAAAPKMPTNSPLSPAISLVQRQNYLWNFFSELIYNNNQFIKICPAGNWGTQNIQSFHTVINIYMQS